MPELGEVAHATQLLRQFLLNQTIKTVEAGVDELLFVKPLTNTVFREALENSKVTGVGRNGKYFWFEVNNAQKVLLHFGMTGWIHVKDVYTHFIAMENAGDKKQKDLMATMAEKPTGPVIREDHTSETWPPKFTKFILGLENGRQIAFSDPRRLGRCRLFDTLDINGLEPIKKLGRDFSQQPLTEEEFVLATCKRKVPVKAYLLDQAVFSGIGNWMGDEILYQAKVHPEQYCHTLSELQLKELYAQVMHVCTVAVETQGNTAAFPENWLMLHRWGKRRKNDPQVLPWGQKFEFLKVGGRTSCFVPDVQIMVKTDDAGAADAPGKAGETETIAPKKRAKAKSSVSKAKRVKKEVESD